MSKFLIFLALGVALIGIDLFKTNKKKALVVIGDNGFLKPKAPSRIDARIPSGTETGPASINDLPLELHNLSQKLGLQNFQRLLESVSKKPIGLLASGTCDKLIPCFQATNSELVGLGAQGWTVLQSQLSTSSLLIEATHANFNLILVGARKSNKTFEVKLTIFNK